VSLIVITHKEKVVVMKVLIPMLGLTILLFGCASGPNPNPGERSADIAVERGAFDQALEIVIPRAELGEPWAQLRMGIYYESGVGVEKNGSKALEWYKKVAVREKDDKWAKGYIVGATGKAGYFAENEDALIAQWQMSGMYYEGELVEKDLEKAYLLINNVKTKSAGQPIFFCCSWSGGTYVTQSAITERESAIVNSMNESQLKSSRIKGETWSPINGL
jgi:hypothetical protein